MKPISFWWAQWNMLSHKTYSYVLEHYGDLERAWYELDASFLRALGWKEQRISKAFSRKLEMDQPREVKILELNSDHYPARLKEIYDPPPFLFVRGTLPDLSKALGIVGTRNMTPYGARLTKRFTREIVDCGYVTISGLALGVDAVVHQETLEAGGKTVAVLGSGVDCVHPRTNVELAKSIVRSGGCLISEFPLGMKPRPHHFPKRNRVISGLSQGVVVTEGQVKSGALITARSALDQNREVFAVPGQLKMGTFSGTHHLIRRGEAKLIEDISHILEEL